MEKFEALLDQATAKNSNNVPGAAVAVVNKYGMSTSLHLTRS